MTTIAHPSAHTAATGHPPAVTWYDGSASATSAPPAAPGTAVPLMELPARENGGGKARGSSLVTGHGRWAGWREARVPADGSADGEKEARS